MNYKKKSICILLLMVMLLSLCPMAMADGINPDKDASLTIKLGYDGADLEGAQFDVYYIASVDSNTHFTPVTEFAGYPIEINDNTVESWNELAVTLKGYAQRDNIMPLFSTTTDADGKIVLDGMTPGLYLVVGQKLVEGNYIYTIQPTIVCLPGLDKVSDNSYKWNYDVTIAPKSSREDKPADETVVRKVMKVWNDNKDVESRPESITVQLLCDGEPYDAVTLTAKMNWRYVWKELPACDENGAKIEWSVVEDELEGYTVKVEQSGITVVITNTPDNPYGPGIPVTPPDLPFTGLYWWPVPVLLSAGLLLIIIGILRRRGYEE